MTCENFKGDLIINLKGVRIVALDGKTFTWWSVDHLAELKSFCKDNLNIDLLKAKLDLFVKAFNSEEGDVEPRIYLVMVHQLYFELLEYIFLLLKVSNIPLEILPVALSTPSTGDIIKFAKVISEDAKVENEDGRMILSGKLIVAVKRIVDLSGIREDYKEPLIMAMYNLFIHSNKDFTDDLHRNVYNSIKHGNRGSSYDGESALITKDGEKIYLLDTDYAYRHSKIYSIDGNRENVYIRPMETFVTSTQLIKRCKILIGYIDFIQTIFIELVDSHDPDRRVEMFDYNAIEEAWAGTNNNGHVLYREIQKFKLADGESLKASANINLSMIIQFSFPQNYNFPFYRHHDIDES